MTYPLTKLGTTVVAIVTLTLSGGALVIAQSSEILSQPDEPEPIVFDEPVVKTQIKDEKLRLEIAALSASTTLSTSEALDYKARADDTKLISTKLQDIYNVLKKIERNTRDE